MLGRRRLLQPLDDRGPLRVMFVITLMPVGGAETLLVQLIRRMDRERFAPELCCLKSLGPLGEVLAREVPTQVGLLANKYDLRVLPRLTRCMRQRQIDAVVTVGTGGDKMFWGRLAAYMAGVPVICSALHSTGLPDRVERLNRLLTPLTDAFIAVADRHAQYLAAHEGCPPERVCVIPNGVDTDRFSPRTPDGRLADALGLLPGQPVVAIVAALRPEKNHELFIQAAERVVRQMPDAKFLIVGDGPCRQELQSLSFQLGIGSSVLFLGTRSDVADILPLVSVVALTSHMEANPVCLLEAMACEKPVVATRVGSVPETVCDGSSGFLVDPGTVDPLANRLLTLLSDPARAAEMGRVGRKVVVERWSIDRMVTGYEDLLSRLYASKAGGAERMSTTSRPEPAPLEQSAG